ncbi:hypothetical protein AVEN_265631-1 [Araneus ventricosus]|uniref:Uncharacterized protein n=1 Tax=Araneus ventricosus TaxID=182803 RepID=A0A4Y2GHZ0_ARAVE|nr:hypothetical protein AVEN_265631-1 [Araneus ventricosus]
MRKRILPANEEIWRESRPTYEILSSVPLLASHLDQFTVGSRRYGQKQLDTEGNTYGTLAVELRLTVLDRTRAVTDNRIDG